MPKLLENLSLITFDQERILERDIEWMWDVEEMVPFLEWFSKYIDDSNVVNSHELERFSNLRNDGLELRGEELDLALKSYGIDVKDLELLDLTDSHLEFCDQAIQELKIQNSVASDIETLLREQCVKSSEREKSAESNLQIAQAGCLKEGQNLMRILVSVKTALSALLSDTSKLISAFKDNEDPKCCLSSMPIDIITDTLEKVCEYTRSCVKRKFEEASITETKTFSELVSFVVEDLSLKSTSSTSNMSTLIQKMWSSQVNEIALQGTLSGYTAAIQHLETLMGSQGLGKTSCLSMKANLLALHTDISKLSEDTAMILKHDVTDLVEDIVVGNIFKVVNNLLSARIERRHLLIKDIKALVDITSKQLFTSDLVCMLLQLQYQGFKVGTCLLNEISDFFTEETLRHKTTMNQLNMVMEDNKKVSGTLRPGQSMLLGIMERLLDNDALDDKSLMSIIQRDKCLENISESTQTRGTQTDPEKSIKELLFEICNGPTKKPNLVNRELDTSMESVRSKLQQCRTEKDRLASLHSAKEFAFEKSQTIRNRRLLWAWFISAPEKLEQALEID